MILVHFSWIWEIDNERVLYFLLKYYALQKILINIKDSAIFRAEMCQKLFIIIIIYIFAKFYNYKNYFLTFLQSTIAFIPQF